MWHVANFVKGLSVDEAIKQLQFQRTKGAIIAKEVVILIIVIKIVWIVWLPLDQHCSGQK